MSPTYNQTDLLIESSFYVLHNAFIRRIKNNVPPFSFTNLPINPYTITRGSLQSMEL